MKRKLLSLLALLLILALLPGCGQVASIRQLMDNLEVPETQPTATLPPATQPGKDTFAQFEYVRPDVDAYQELVDQACQALDENASQLLDRVWEIYDAYDHFYTMLTLADIRYCLDLSDTYYRTEYEYCSSQSVLVESGIEALYQALAQSDARTALERQYFGSGFFDGYLEDSLWSETFSDLMSQESDLINRFYQEMDRLSYDDYDAMAQSLGPIFLELIDLRQRIAQEAGYPDYETFVYDWYYCRDFTPQQAADYLAQIREILVPLYVEVNQSSLWQEMNGSPSQSQCQAYLSSAAEAMGGGILDAYQTMTRRELYDIAPGSRKYQGSFEVYLTEFQVPFLLVNPAGDLTDYLSFAHEFGHFVNDYLTAGSYLSTDMAEVMSQSMEYLSLLYATEPSQATLNRLQKLKLADCLCVYVEQAAFYDFEQQAYRLSGEDLTVENLNAIYNQVALDYGFQSVGWDEAEWTGISHYFTDPFYIISYVVSGDAAFQLYQMECGDTGSGLAVYEELVQLWEDAPFQTMLEEYGLESPFAGGRLETVERLLREKLLEA